MSLCLCFTHDFFCHKKLLVPTSESVPAGTEWTRCSWGSCSFGCQSVAWWTRSPSWRECGDGLWFGWRCRAHSLPEWKRERAMTRDTGRGGGDRGKKKMHDSTAASIHLTDSFHLRRPSLTSEREKSIWRERLKGAVWQTRPLFTFWGVSFSLFVPFFSFFQFKRSISGTDGAKQQLLYATLHLLVNDIQDFAIVRWSWLWCRVEAAGLLSSTYIDRAVCHFVL